MHERPPKETALEVVFYERNQLLHCAKTVDAKKEQADKSLSPEDKAEYYLAIEGFLLHYRNLLGFFIYRGNDPTDLTLARMDKWADGRPVDEPFCHSLRKRAQRVNKTHGIEYGDEKTDCYGKISWFLQHCTDYRYKAQRDWDIARMYADLSPILDEFVASVMPVAEVGEVILLGAPSYGTATITKSGPLL
jgi:hypothetical protein